MPSFKVAQTIVKQAVRILELSEYVDLIHNNKLRLESNKKLYHQHQAIVKHPLELSSGNGVYSYIMTKKSLKRASTDVGLIFVAYNLRKIMNILGQDKLQALSLVFAQ